MNVRALIFGALILGAAGCKSPLTTVESANIILKDTKFTFSGSPVSKVLVVGTAVNNGTLAAHGVQVTAWIDTRYNVVLTSPSELGPGESGHFAIAMTASKKPQLEVFWR